MTSNQFKKTVSAESGGTFKTLRNLWPYMWPSDRIDLKRRVVWALFYLVVAKVVLLSVTYFFKFATNALEGRPIVSSFIPGFALTPLMLVLAYNFARIFQAGINQLRDALFAKVGQHAVRGLAYKTFIHMHQLSLRFHLERRTGGVSRIIERGIKGIESIVRFTILNTAPTTLEFALTAGVFWYSYGWRYALIVAITVILYTWFTIKASNWRMAIRRDMNDSDTEANTRAVDSLLNYETVKYFGNEKLEVSRYDASMAKYEQAATKTWISLGWLNFGQSFIFGIGMASLMLMSAYEVMQGAQTIGDFVFVNALLMQLSIPLNFIGSIYREVRQGLTDIEAMFDLLDVPQEVRDRADAKPIIMTQASISFNNVSFAYDPARPILKNISFSVAEGKTLAIVGPSGAGKSTISRLLYRFFDVQNGAILVSGQDIRHVTQDSLRHQIGMVPQDTVLFNDTIAYNIRYGRQNATDDEVRNAADLAQISAFIEKLPDGYQSLVGERGLKLSGGEKQRVAIARTLLKAPPILVLDEATSALDTATEREIQDALDVVSRDRTTILIAHRLSTVVNADEIIVLVDGEIVERGSHTTLLNKNALYASMWNQQREIKHAEEHLANLKEINSSEITDNICAKTSQQ